MCQFLGQARHRCSRGQASLTSFSLSPFVPTPPLPAPRPPSLSPTSRCRAMPCDGARDAWTEPLPQAARARLCPAAGGALSPRPAGRRAATPWPCPRRSMAAPAVCPARGRRSDEAGMLPASPRRRRLRQLLPGAGGRGSRLGGRLQPLPASEPEVMKRRRGGIIEQRDIIKAHEAHKMQSTRRRGARSGSEYRGGWVGAGRKGPGRSRGAVGVSWGKMGPARQMELSLLRPKERLDLPR